MTFWDLANGRQTDLTPIQDPSTAMAVAKPAFTAAVGVSMAMGFAYAMAAGGVPVVPGALSLREGIRMATESIDRGIPLALSSLEEQRQRVVAQRLEQAVRFYERVIKARPDDIESLISLSISYSAQGRLRDAMSTIDKALQASPENHNAWLRKGTFSLANRDLNGARSAFDKATQNGPEDPEAWSNLGLVYQQLGDAENARYCWETVSILKPEDVSGWLNWASLAYSLGKINEAVSAWKEAIALNRKLVPPWQAAYESGNSSFVEGNAEDALAAFDEAIRLNPQYSDPWIGKALCAKKMGRLPHAIEFLNQAVSRDQRNAKAWFIRGNFLSDLSRHEDANTSWQEAFSLDPTIRVPWVAAYDEGCKYLAANQPHSAIGHFQRAIQLCPNYAEAWFKKGVAHRPIGQTEEARQAWAKVLSLTPEHSLALMNLGNLEFGDSHHELAIQLWEKALEVDGNLAQAAMNLGAAMADKGRLKEAAGFFTKAESAGHPLGRQAYALCKIYDDMDPAVGPVA